jgi:hypothetical protein
VIKSRNTHDEAPHTKKTLHREVLMLVLPTLQTAHVFALQTAGEVARARFWGGRRFVGVLLIVLLVLGIAVLAKKLTK